jgi:hypothetical protein
MKLTAPELAEVTRQVNRNAARVAPGEPGSREQPLPYARLLEQRRRNVTGRHG